MDQINKIDLEQAGETMVVPAFKNCQELKLNVSGYKKAITSMPLVKNLVPTNYSNLEYTFQEAWREARVNAIKVGDAIKKAKQNIEEIKADIILTEIPKLLEGHPKTKDNTDFRKAVISKNENYKQASEYLEKLEALEAHFDSHMKIMENTSRFMKKQMDYYIRSGVISNGITSR
jgi:hypothetical protein